ncbi:hypothetical protein LRAMOSA07725 [Lichtheimia ramosa]|uniref:Uncharacterized protein n=1 Tax=Lichtheimia ramosa TaxID=688394 RepID=A0A077WBT2_9FUNG|nr:hypothetical protein LRAMOSA07725 [Lichtheimia ramosa]
MRTSRGLRITSLIVAFPVLLILSSLVLICALAIQTQVKAWAAQHQPQFLDVAQRPISRLATSTALALSPKPFTRRFILKHFLPSTVWSWLGVLTVFALITVQKLDIVSCSQKAYAFITPPSSPTMAPASTATTMTLSDDNQHVSLSGATTSSKPLSSKPRKKKLRSKQQQQRVSKQQHYRHHQSAAAAAPPSPPPSPPARHASKPTMTTTAAHNVLEDTSSSEEEEWINVGDKKKKQRQSHNDSHYHHSSSYEPPKTPVMSDADEEEETETEPEETLVVVQEQQHHEKQQQEQQQTNEQPVIRNWYSPFSTGLDLDIMPSRNKHPYHHQQQHWREDPFYQHAPLFEHQQAFSFFDRPHAMRV